jgi:hypothetical protein
MYWGLRRKTKHVRKKLLELCRCLKLTMQALLDNIAPNMFYNGWTHGHYIICIFVFAPDGKIRICFLNSPGCWQDSTQADHGGVYDKIEEVYEATGGKVVMSMHDP